MKMAAKKLEGILLRRVRRANAIFSLFDEGDKILLALSGGADSLVMFRLLTDDSAPWYGKLDFFPVFIHSGFPADDMIQEKLIPFVASRGYELVVKNENIYEVLQKSHTMSTCFTCSRMRRKLLVRTARHLSADKIALAHHKDDVVETFLLNILFNREISAIVPKQELFRGLFYIIRPMVLCDEKQIKRYAQDFALPVVEEKCPYADLSRRKIIKDMLESVSRVDRNVKNNIFMSLFKVKLDYLYTEYQRKRII